MSYARVLRKVLERELACGKGTPDVVGFLGHPASEEGFFRWLGRPIVNTTNSQPCFTLNLVGRSSCAL